MMLLVSTAMAENINITISHLAKDTAAHTYGAYQIFSGVSNAATTDPIDPKLEDVSWGADITDASGFITALKAAFTDNEAITALKTTDTAGVVAGAITTLNADPYQKDDQNAQALAAFFGSYFTGDPATAASKVVGTAGQDVTVPVPGQGYYFIKDMTAVDSGAADDKVGASTRFILEVVGGVTIAPKADVPSVSKDVDDVDDSTTGEDAIAWQKTADYDIGDSIPYRITGTLPSNYGDYERYNYIFHDSMSTGLAYDSTKPAKVVLYADQETLDADAAKGYSDFTGTDITSYFTVAGADQTLTVSVNNFATAGADKLGLKLLDGTDSKPSVTKDSKIVVYYYATLLDAAVIGKTGNTNDVYLEFSNNPNAGGEGETGTTTKDTDIVFTYKVDADKVNENVENLDGAQFALLKKLSAAPTGVDSYKAKTNTSFADGDYVQDGTDYYKYVGAFTMDSTKKNQFEFRGIDAGSYMIIETTTPTGYNTMDPITFTVTATHGTTGHETEIDEFTVSSTDATFAAAKAGGDISMNIKNKSNTDVAHAVTTDTETASSQTGEAAVATVIKNQSGATLPETGGVGTTIFYVAGSILVLAAAILLITKRRMGAQD